MPIYEYICDTCHDEFEVRRSFSDEGVPPCPTCNGTGKVHKVFSPPAIVFKGKGFYVTDSRGKSSTSTTGSKRDSADTDSDRKTEPKKAESKNTESSSEKSSEKSKEKSKD
jgi:putative FmdB family regulatory protein